MYRLREKVWFTTLAAAAGMTLTAILTARLLLRHISLFLSFDASFSTIFAQIRDAALTTPIWLLLALAILAAWGLRWLGRSKGWRIAAGILWVLLWLALFAGALLLTRVNGIRFADVLLSLLDVLKKGGLDGL